jgi:hypothetical protein
MEILNLDKVFGNIEEKIKDYSIIFMDTAIFSPIFKNKNEITFLPRIFVEIKNKSNLERYIRYSKDYMDRLESLVRGYTICTIPEVINEAKNRMGIDSMNKYLRNLKRAEKGCKEAIARFRSPVYYKERLIFYEKIKYNLRSYVKKSKKILKIIEIKDKSPDCKNIGLYNPIISAAFRSRKFCRKSSNSLRTDELLVAKAHYFYRLNKDNGRVIILTYDKDLDILSQKTDEMYSTESGKKEAEIEVYNLVPFLLQNPENFLRV